MEYNTTHSLNSDSCWKCGKYDNDEKKQMKNRTSTAEEKIVLFSESPADINLPPIHFCKPLRDISSFLDNGDDSSTSTTLLPEPPDGGYGWVIVFLSFMIHFICDGISFSFGILFSHIQEYFGTTTTVSGIIASIFLSIPLLLGPVAGVLTDIYDCRKVTIAGGFIAAAGAFISYFARNEWEFLFSFGVTVGLGLCLCFNTAIVAVTYYFEKKRALATGIAVCGSGAGATVVALFLEQLFASFGWHITLLSIGMLLLLLVACGLLIKDLEWPQDTLEYKRKKFIEKAERAKLFGLFEAQQTSSGSTFMVGGTYDDLRLRNAISLPQLPTFTDLYQQKPFAFAKNEVKGNIRPDAFSRCRSDGAFLRNSKNREIVSFVDASSPLFRDPVEPTADGPIPCRFTSGYDESVNNASVAGNRDIWSSPVHDDDCECESNNMKETSKRKDDDEGNDVTTRITYEVKEEGGFMDTGTTLEQSDNKQIIHEKYNKLDKTKFLGWGNGYINSYLPGEVPMQQRVPLLYTAAQGRVPASNVITYGCRYYGFGNFNCRAPSAPVIFFRRKRKSHVINVAKILESCNEWISVVLSLLSVPSFSIYLISSFLLYLFFDIPYVNFPEHATQHLGVTVTQASYLVAIIGVFNTLSMLVCGLLADWSVMKDYLMQLYGGFIFMAGVCVLLAPFAESYYFLMLLCACFGFFISANYVLSSVLTVHLLCLYDFQTGYGLLCLVEGLGNLLGPALVGFVRDHQSSYHYIFVFGGLGTVISGLMVTSIDVFLRKCNETSGILTAGTGERQQLCRENPGI